MAIKPTDGQKRVSFVAPSTRSMLPTSPSNGRAPVAKLGFQPTEEQEAIRAAAATGEDVAVIALAGTGKTTTLQMLAKDRPRQLMTYVAFNRAIADEAQRRFPSNTVCKTMHSFAFGAVGRHYTDRLNGARVPAWKAANILRIPERFEYGAFSLRSHQLARLALEAVQRFCHSDSPEPSRSHIPKVPGMDSPEARGALEQMLYPYVAAAWDDLSGQTGQLRFGHDIYLKIWSLGNPSLPGDVVLADEAQDFDPVIKQIVEGQTNSQKIYVGDENQTIYEWRGSINAFDSLNVPHRLPLQQCQPPGTMVRVPDEFFRGDVCGANAIGWKNVPIESLSRGDRVVSWDPRQGLRKRGRELTDVSVVNYDGPLVTAKVGEHSSRYALHHDCVVVLGTLTEGDYVVYMMRRGNQYRIGRCPWRYVSTGIGPIRRAVGEGADAVWVLSVHDSVAEAALHEALAQTEFGVPGVGWKVFPGSRGYKMPLDVFWDKISDNSDRANRCLQHHGLLIDYPLWSRSENLDRPGAGWSTRVTTAAANLRNGMLMLTSESTGSSNGSDRGYTPWSAWTPINVNREWYSGPIYSISVDVEHTYVADEIVTHNSFRFGPRIATEANRILEILESPLRIVGNVNKDSHLAYLSEPDCVLTRTNSEAIARLMAAQVEGVRAGLVGGTAQVEALAQAALDLTNGRKTTHHELLAFDNWQQVREYVEEDSDAKELQVLVKLVDRHGAEVLLDAVQRAVPEHTADLVISTAHKAKGREWERVAIASDFQEPRDEDTGEWNKSELRLSYVAITRAKEFLDCSALGWLTWQAGDDPERQFLAASEVPERECVEVAHAPTEQLIPDPEDATRLMFCRTPYNAELVDAQRGLPRSKFYGLYCGEEKVRVVLATVQAIAVAERFHLTISDAARARVAELAG